MSEEKQKRGEAQKDEHRAAVAAGAAAGPESDPPRPTPGVAEGDRETVEQDIQDKLGNNKNQ
jgi:hypothetical protein